MDKIELHLKLCDNEATALQYKILATQLPSMNQRIQDAYQNTRDFVNFIQETLPVQNSILSLKIWQSKALPLRCFH